MEMESSSPLAAMHRPTIAQPWVKRDMDAFLSLPRTAGSGGVSSFGLCGQLHRPNADYFNVKDVRGSSPAASLAADLSQNFRLDSDNSPRFPTPRRNLFSAAVMMGTEAREYITTPPLPSSSPARVIDKMDTSPLPAKTPLCTAIEITSPTPAQTPEINEDDDDDEMMMLDSPAPISRQSSFEATKPTGFDRSKPVPRRPSLSRMKVYSTTILHTRSSVDNQLPSFRFGGDSRLAHMSSAASLGESFESPSCSQETRPQTANSPPQVVPTAMRPRQGPNFGGMGSSRNGSPIHGHVRRPSNPFSRSRKHFRRTLSMFEHPEDVMKPKSQAIGPAATALESVMDVEEAKDPVLPHFFCEDPGDTIPRISKETLLDVLDGQYSGYFDQRMVIDCRFEYEYDGGHIDGAVNYNDKELLSTQLFRTPMEGRTLLVFHCEYSAHRAPLMARHVRSEDRSVNAEHYPKLTYPEVYILEGGYSEFFANHRLRCYPQSYVEMSDEKHQRTCERELNRLKARKAPTLGRAKTFAFGVSMSESPTAPERSVRLPAFDLMGNSPILGDQRGCARRLASY